MYDRPNCPVDEDVQVWIEDRMNWLVGQFGWERFAELEVILPIEEHFPAPYDGSQKAVFELFEQVCAYMEIDPETVELKFYSEGRVPFLSTAIVHERSGGTAGRYQGQAGKAKIWLETSNLDDPICVVATLAHELCHEHLLGGSRLSGDEADHEAMTDLATIYFGMGVFIANASLRDRNTRRGNWEAWNTFQQRSAAYLGLGAVRQALADADMAVAKSPDDSESYAVRGKAFLETRQDYLAAADFTRFLEKEDTSGAAQGPIGTVYYLRGVASSRLNDLEQAERDFSRALRIFPNWAAGYAARADVYDRMGEFARAEADREEASRLG
jgi:tetratricopeptide (TPR) repeat protein